MLQLLEMRLDTVCFTLGFGKTVAHARQLVNHGHITVNKKVVSIASFQCRINDIIGVKEKPAIQSLIQSNLKENHVNELPSHLNFDSSDNLYPSSSKLLISPRWQIF